MSRRSRKGLLVAQVRFVRSAKRRSSLARRLVLCLPYAVSKMTLLDVASGQRQGVGTLVLVAVASFD
jgi:hypothetical protein